jgi:uncharacterized protein (DUF488 family)
MESAGRLFTVGHSNHEAADFLALLRGAGITAIADVRSSPYSRRLPHFTRVHLEALLTRNGIAYVFLGDLLGGRPADEALYDGAGLVDYERVRATERFRRGLERVVRGVETYTIALFCAEEDPLDCHRGLMIAPALVEVGLVPEHLRRGGWVESQADFEERLQQEAGVGGLFGLGEAYRILNRKVGYRLERED